MRSFTVCVGYSEALAVTMPYNRDHFTEMHVATTPEDSATIALCIKHGAKVHATHAFTARGALFNKWAALEEMLDAAGRHGWLCMLDADVLIPKNAPMGLRMGMLLAPLRRMCPTIELVPEHRWSQHPYHRNVGEWAGYMQVFHGDDAVLGPPPWHDVDWRHAGGADSFFQAKWPRERRIRTPWEVLHLGPAGVNWAGIGNEGALGAMLRGRCEGRGFADEKLS